MSAANGRNLDALVGLPPVLDVCCGPRGMWFDKRNPLAMFTDRRSETITMDYPSGHYVEQIEPDMVADFTDLPFPDNTFALVVMDPPHIAGQTEASGRIVKRYGMACATSPCTNTPPRGVSS